jgi:SAM-dependent methyltransferase
MTSKLYESLAEWWPLMSAPAEYEEAAAVYAEHLAQSGDTPANTVLELGSGGGNIALFLKQRFQMTLVDLSEGMLAHSRSLNPECEHHQGDMRTFRLGACGQFDRVFIQDSIFYMTNLQDLAQAMETAFFHCRPGGALLIAPDCVSETFRPDTHAGGQDRTDRSMRYLEWHWDPDPSDHTYLVDFAFLLRDSSGSLRVESDRHVGGLFRRAEWLRLLREAGFVPANLTFHHSDVDHPLDLFVGVKRSAPFPSADHLSSGSTTSIRTVRFPGSRYRP